MDGRRRARTEKARATAELVAAIPAVVARDVPAAMAFWVNTLGFRLVFSVDGFACVARDSVRLFIAECAGEPSADDVQVWFVVSNLDVLHDEWSAKLPTGSGMPNCPALTEVMKRPWGRGFALYDRAGNRVHFVDEGSDERSF